MRNARDQILPPFGGFFIARSSRAFSYTQRKIKMLCKTKFIGNGKTKEYYFTFMYFQKSDVRVSLDDALLTGDEYAVNTYPKTIAGINASGCFNYQGGKITFAAAPAQGVEICIFRSLDLTRAIDYQPAGKINPEQLNSDFNFLLELFKEANPLELDIHQVQSKLNRMQPKIITAETAAQTMGQMLEAGTPVIGENGNWWIGETDTGKPARGASGEKGEMGETGAKGDKGDKGAAGEDGVTDLSNLTDAQKTTIARLSFPSDQYIDFALPESNGTWTAPADGYVNVRRAATAALQYVQVKGPGLPYEIASVSVAAGYDMTLFFPVSAGKIITFVYVGGNTLISRFIYANGAV
jgi:hypothetical protein